MNRPSFNANLSSIPGNYAASNSVHGSDNTIQCDLEIYEPIASKAQSYSLPLSKPGAVVPDSATRTSLNRWFSVIAGSRLKPFAEGKLDEKTILAFAYNIAFGLTTSNFSIDEPAKPTMRCRNLLNRACDKRIDEKELERIADIYFQSSIARHGLESIPSAYATGCYTAKQCSDGEMAFVFSVVEKVTVMPDSMTLVDLQTYQGMESNYAECRCDLGIRQRISDASAIGDYETVRQLCPEWDSQPREKMKARIKFVGAGATLRPVLVGYEQMSK